MSKKLFYYGSTASFSNLWSNNYDGVDEEVHVADNDAFTFGNNVGAGGTDQPFSFTCWVKLDIVNTTLRALMGKSAGAGIGREYFMFATSGGIRFLLQSYNSNAWIGRNTNSTLMSTNVWYFVAGTYSGSKAASGIKIYIGTESTAVVQRDTANNNNLAYTGMGNGGQPLTLGAHYDGSSQLDGRQAAPAFWNKELSSVEVEEIRQKKMGDLRTVSCAANLIEAWHFPGGQSDYPTYTGYNNGYNGTMDNQENTDINVDVPV